jgi:hypothetical protein
VGEIFFPFFPLPWWERIEVRGPQLSSTFVSKLQTWIFILGFHPHPDLLPSREKESKSVIARSSTDLWLGDVAISSTHSVILRSVLCDVRIPSFKVFMKKEIKR